VNTTFEKPLAHDEVLVVVWDTKRLMEGFRAFYARLVLHNETHKSREQLRADLRTPEQLKELSKPIHSFRSKISEADTHVALFKGMH
jgi:hypothetical protein